MSESFVHLHLHSEYSTLDGMCRTREVAARAKELGMPAVALTDHGALYGAVEFYQSCQREGIKAILGCEIYLAPGSMEDRAEVAGRKRATHMTLLAETQEGWQNLQKLITRGHLEGMYYGKPRVDRAALAQHARGLIALSGCLNGPINELLLAGQREQARELAEELRGIFGAENFFFEIHHHGLEEQETLRRELAAMGREMGVPLVAANDVHFLHREDHEAHDVMLCIGTGRLLLDENRMRSNPELYFKTAEEMRTLFAEFPEACDQTLAIAQRCQVDFQLDATSSEKYPEFPTPDGSPREEYFRRVCYEGLEKRYGRERAEGDEELRQRLDYEIATINELKFASYFLITADFINWAKGQGIPVGPGRGSAAGSLVAYTMGITDLCPMRFGLLFERFLNPERVSPPDVDIDFCQSRRGEVIGYVRQKYGERCVSHIITYGTLGAKSVLRDVARVMGVSYGEADVLAKMIEAKPGVKLAQEYEAKAELREAIEGSSTYTELWDYALRLEGLTRNVGVHAAGIVIGDRDLDEHVPLTRGNEGEVVTQYDMGAITEVGLLKMDFLGLKNMTVIQETVNQIRTTRPDFSLDDISFEDPLTFEMLNRGETKGVFQLESGGMVETCRKYDLSRIEDIIDLVAVYRPGAMQFIDDMLAVKKGEKEPVYEHPLLETVCGQTYGVMIYQEQVQNAAKLLAGYSLGGADLLRRAMGKKKKEEMDKQRVIFVEGAKRTNDIEERLANKIFDKIAAFAGYGFNKSHSACYGLIAYWTAYLKANFPVEFMAALLSNEINNTEKIGVFVEECHRMGLTILPPNLNASQLRFTPEQTPSGQPGIRYGLSAIKNVGTNAMASAIAQREEAGHFASMEDFCHRLDSKVVNKRILENLIKAGALDWTQETRASLFARIEGVLASASAAQRDRAAGQVALFDAMEFSRPAEARQSGGQELPEWPKDQRLTEEKELLGFYVTGHPLDRYRGVVDADKYCRLGLLDELELQEARQRFAFAGMVRSVEHKMTKKGKPFGVLVVEDFTGSSEVLAWSESYLPAREANLLQPGQVIRFQAAVQVDDRTQQRRLTASRIQELKTRRKGKNGPVELLLRTATDSEEDLRTIAQVLGEHPGKNAVILHFQHSDGRRHSLEVGEQFRVRKSAALHEALARWTLGS